MFEGSSPRVTSTHTQIIQYYYSIREGVQAGFCPTCTTPPTPGYLIGMGHKRHRYNVVIKFNINLLQVLRIRTNLSRRINNSSPYHSCTKTSFWNNLIFWVYFKEFDFEKGKEIIFLVYIFWVYSKIRIRVAKMLHFDPN